ncbi:hypothetical protein ACIQYG_13945 [Peribacillus sp. NPDC096622]
MSNKEKKEFELKCPMCYMADFIVWANEKRKNKKNAKKSPQIPCDKK